MNWSTKLIIGDGKNYSPAFGLPGTSYEIINEDGEKHCIHLDQGENPPLGVIFHYYLSEAYEEDFELKILNSSGEVIESFQSKIFRKDSVGEEFFDEEDKKPDLPRKKGLNQFVWNMRHPGPLVKIDKSLEKPGYMPLGLGEPVVSGGPVVAPECYQAVMNTGDIQTIHSFEILKDPRLKNNPDDYLAQTDLWIKICEQLSKINAGLNRLRRFRKEICGLLERPSMIELSGESKFVGIIKHANTLVKNFDAIERELVQLENETPSDRLRNPMMLKDRLEGLISVVAVAESSPPTQAVDVFDHLSRLLDQQFESLKSLEDGEIEELNQMILEAGLPHFQS